MYTDYALLKFKSNLESICIDIQYLLLDEEPEIKEEYFTKELTDGIETEDLLPNGDGTYTKRIYMKREQIWGFNYDGSPENSFFRNYSSLEKALHDEIELNRKTVTDFDEVALLYEDLCTWLTYKVNRITYIPGKDRFECDYVHYSKNFNRITFKGRYNSEIQGFYKELKDRLMQTYVMVIEKIPSPIFKPNLKWEGSDTDLIELITSLVENKTITVKVGKTSRKEVINQFAQIFDIKIKDAESKLSRATDRNDVNSKILTSLQNAYKKYATSKLG